MCRVSTIEKKAARYLEIKKAIDELKAEQDDIREFLLEELKGRGVSEIKAGEYKVSVSSINQTRVDGTKLKETYPMIYETFSKVVPQTRLTVK